MTWHFLTWPGEEKHLAKKISKNHVVFLYAFSVMMHRDISFPNLNISGVLGIFPHFSPPFRVTNRREQATKLCTEVPSSTLIAPRQGRIPSPQPSGRAKGKHTWYSLGTYD